MTTGVLDGDVALKVVSDASGRMRVRVTGFGVDAIRAVAIEEMVSQVTGVQAVQAYPRTASVVVWYMPQACDTADVLSAIAEAEHIPAESVPARPRTRLIFQRPVCCDELPVGSGWRCSACAVMCKTVLRTARVAAAAGPGRSSGASCRRTSRVGASGASGGGGCGWPSRWGW